MKYVNFLSYAHLVYIFSLCLNSQLYAEDSSNYVSKEFGFSILTPQHGADAPRRQLAVFYLAATDHYSPNVTIQCQQITFDKFISLTDDQFSEVKITVISRVIKDSEITYEYFVDFGKLPLHCCLRAIKRGDDTLVAVGTSLQSQWDEVGDSLRKSVSSFERK